MDADELSGWRGLLTRRGPVLALALAAVVAVPSLPAQLFVDDYLHAAKLEGTLPSAKGDLFAFASGKREETMPLIERGPYPWWTWPELRFVFLRPLSTALARADHQLFGRALAFKHLHSAAWWLALVAVVTALFRRTLGAGTRAGQPVTLVAGAAMLLFALDDVHWMPVAWLANRNALVATVPTLLGLLAHLRWREDGWRPGLFLSVPLYAVGLAGGEAALGALAYLAAYELLAGPGGPRARALALLPVAALGAGYVALYKGLGAGAVGSGIYLDPLASPGAFLLAAPGRVLALVGAQVLGTTADLWLVAPATVPFLVGAGVAALALLAWLLRAAAPHLSPAERRHLPWLALGALLSLLPMAATFPLNRLLLATSVGGAAVVAVVLVRVPWRGAARWGAGALFVANVVGAPLGWVATYAIGHALASGQTRSALETGLSDEALTRRVVFFAAPDPAVALYPAMVRVFHGHPVPESWLPISFAPYSHRLTRVAHDTVELEVLGGRMLETVFEQLFRSGELPVPAGFEVALHRARLTVVALDRGLPQRVRLRLEAPDDAGWTFVQWRGGRLEPLALPAVGESVVLVREAGTFPAQ